MIARLPKPLLSIAKTPRSFLEKYPLLIAKTSRFLWEKYPAYADDQVVPEFSWDGRGRGIRLDEVSASAVRVVHRLLTESHR
jgi:hypothetical protein